MKTKIIGLVILITVIIAAVIYVMVGSSNAVTEIKGYVGGEKIGLLEDEDKLSIDYAKAGSIDMITADSTGMDFLFP